MMSLINMASYPVEWLPMYYFMFAKLIQCGFSMAAL